MIKTDELQDAMLFKTTSGKGIQEIINGLSDQGYETRYVVLNNQASVELSGWKAHRVNGKRVIVGQDDGAVVLMVRKPEPVKPKDELKPEPEPKKEYKQEDHKGHKK